MKKVVGLISGAFSTLFLAVPVFADNVIIDICPDSLGSPAKEICKLGKDVANLGNLIRVALTSIFIFAILIAIFFLILGGVKWIISGGDKSAVEGARNTIVAAIVGLVIIIIAFLIINVLGNILGVNPFQQGGFTIPKVQP